eukprot:scaffold51832_cov60-Phaeocystis_antarctica.AAC.4
MRPALARPRRPRARRGSVRRGHGRGAEIILSTTPCPLPVPGPGRRKPTPRPTTNKSTRPTAQRSASARPGRPRATPLKEGSLCHPSTQVSLERGGEPRYGADGGRELLVEQQLRELLVLGAEDLHGGGDE